MARLRLRRSPPSRIYAMFALSRVYLLDSDISLVLTSSLSPCVHLSTYPPTMPEDPEFQCQAAETSEYHSDEEDTSHPESRPSSAQPSRPNPNITAGRNTNHRSIYQLTSSEQLRGVANRILFSRYYVAFYFAMMCLSLTTVVLSLMATRELVLFFLRF